MQCLQCYWLWFLRMQGRFGNCKAQISESKCLFGTFLNFTRLFRRRLTSRMNHYVCCCFADEVIKPWQPSPVLFLHGFWCSTETPPINIIHLICAAITKHTGEIPLRCVISWVMVCSASPTVLQTVAVANGRVALLISAENSFSSVSD